ncbi:hypothetical protein [Pseudomonas mangiferae]|uniref:Uncharacterized protein n=1 Tax=Pseudomonas mangiferae TaxID=2593654 RepID=A0A553GVV8_9PSED|nr:hypothetical protein [Pseudomonas mangiferae]TRX73615.1 hypothetical protein FM069_17005 [Pseudomonas mangiferae]
MKETHPNKVVDLTAHRARRHGSAREPLYATPPRDAAEEVPEMGDKEKVWWRNTLFFTERLVHNPAYGAVRFRLARLRDQRRMLHFTCKLYEAYYTLDDCLMIDFEQPVMLVRWSGRNDPGYPLVPRPAVLHEE